MLLGDEDVRCLETSLMLKSTLPNAGLSICPNTGHAINVEEPFAFNAQIENFLGAVERGSWRRGFPGIEVAPHLGGEFWLRDVLFGRIFPETARRTGQRSPESVPHRRSVRCAVHNRCRASALDA